LCYGGSYEIFLFTGYCVTMSTYSECRYSISFGLMGREYKGSQDVSKSLNFKWSSRTFCEWKYSESMKEFFLLFQ
jgi:hypothetical protein